MDFFFSSMSLNCLPGMNHGTSRAGTVTVISGFRGLRAIRLLRRRFSKVPNPTSATRSPFTTRSRITSIELSITARTSVLLRPVRRATSVTNPPLFM